jgi:hypothetical protein
VRPALVDPLHEAIATLNDRALRRLLGARAFLRGYDYVRRHAVDQIQIGDASAHGHVRGTEPEPYNVQLQLTPNGFAGGGIVPTGIDAWLPEPMPPMPKTIEYRLQVKPAGTGRGRGRGADRDAARPEARARRSCRARSSAQGQTPTADRDAIRLLARFENEGPRRVGIEVRGEDASDLLPLLKGRRVIVEPQMMELRFGDEPLRPRFDLELSQDGTQILVKSSFQRPGDPRKFTTGKARGSRGAPAGTSIRRRGWRARSTAASSPASIRRLVRAPFIHEPIERLPQLIAQGLPKVALEVGAELPELSQVADVVDLVPTFRMRAGGSLTEARVALRAAYEDVEMDVRADGMTPPVIVKPAPEDPGARSAPAASGATSPRSRRRPASSATSASSPTRRATASSPAATTPSSSGPRDRPAARGVGPLRPGRSGRRARARRGAERERARVERRRLAVAAPVVRERGRRGHRRTSSDAASPRGGATCASPTARSRGSTPRRCARCSSARPRSSRPGEGRGASCRSRRRAASRSCSSRSASRT